MRNSRRAILVGVLVILIGGGAGGYAWLSRGNTVRIDPPPPPEVAGRQPLVWAEAMDRPGLPNLHQVSETLYRGAQPELEGFAELKKMGVKTVISLRAFHSDREMIGDLPLNYQQIEMKTWHAEDEDVVRFLKLATDPANQPVFVHCQHGADRTGICCAAYRIVVQDWSKEDAIAEMTHGGFGFHPMWENLIDYVQKMDVAKMRESAGITKGG